ncbi:MAG TPA: RNA 2',3'-cyclic phosphodiesterase [Bacillaceae bacterium]
MSSAHFFFALRLPAPIKEQLHHLSRHIQQAFPFKNWVHHEDYHITLAFLGNAPQDKLSEAIDRTAQALQELPAIALDINRTGFFGTAASPRILWAGAAESRWLQEVQEHVYTACTLAGFELDRRPFKPHITLARKWMGKGSFLPEKLEHHVASHLPLQPFHADEVVLYQTHLDRSPKYEIKESFTLSI